MMISSIFSHLRLNVIPLEQQQQQQLFMTSSVSALGWIGWKNRASNDDDDVGGGAPRQISKLREMSVA